MPPGNEQGKFSDTVNANPKMMVDLLWKIEFNNKANKSL